MYISFLAHSKGLRHLIRRMWTISRSYGLKPTRMGQALERLITVLETYGGQATLPIPAVILVRHPALVRRLQTRGIELAVHGWTHIPLDNRSADEQYAHLCHAQDIFAAAGIPATGFRAPYLRRDDNLRAAAEKAGFTYVSNQPILWAVLEAEAFSPASYAAYERAVAFYVPWRASERLSLPQLYNQLVEIPVSLPDDEILGDRLGGDSDLIKRAWQLILVETHRRGELFTIQLHPERIARCANGLIAVLAEARTLTPPVWFTRLDEIATWWRARARASVEITDAGDGRFHLVVAGPEGTTVLARAVKVDAPTMPWTDGYQRVETTTFTIRAPQRPFIGVSPGASKLADFLRQQGYIFEINEKRDCYSHYFDQTEFTVEHERQLLAQIEGTDRPLVRLGRWPNGARSALAITGDIDALTLWDYGLRFLGR